MAIVEINLEKPALVEEYRYSGETSEGTQSSATHSKSSSGSKSSGGGKGKLLGLLALVAAVGVLVWKRKSGGSGGQSQSEEGQYEHGPEPEIGGDESGGPKRKVASALGLMVAVATLGAAVRKRRR
ncbi:hypothetical protein [Halorussus sp. MSC15.2]|uniref:hypothetical protein n=1 Tax=Halorussus sp. MSC15.2 TaxID=2283638 RepID=UPI0013D4EBA1|nr:hypothetical protein [Halorussus sp. MSC15.2]NEU58888.1 hypothetical protein [Halorussus sp. MSC15.2]